MILIDGQQVTSVSVSAGATIYGRVANNEYYDFIDIDGALEYDVSKGDIGEGFDFSLVVPTQSTDIQIRYNVRNSVGEITDEVEVLSVVISNPVHIEWRYYGKTQTLKLESKNYNGLTLPFYCYDNATITIENTNDWITNAKIIETSTAEKQLSIYIQQNYSTESRQGTIAVKASGTGGVADYIYATLNQDGAEQEIQSEFSISQHSIEIESYADSEFIVAMMIDVHSVNIKSITPTSNVSWMRTAYNRLNSAVELYPSKNTSPIVRNGRIDVVAVGLDGVEYRDTIEVTQRANANGTIIASEYELYLGYRSGSTSTLYYTLTNIDDNAVGFIPSPNLGVYFDWVLDKQNRVIVFTAKSTNESMENEREIQGSYLFGVDEKGKEIRSKTISVIQSTSPNYYQFPIWKDFEINLGETDDYLYYRFLDNQVTDKILYQARAYAVTNPVLIRANDILRNFVTESMDMSREGWQDNNGFIETLLQVSDDGINWKDDSIVRFFNDWSYEERKGATAITNDCVNDSIVDVRQKFLFSVMDKYDMYDSTDYTNAFIDLTFEDGTFTIIGPNRINNAMKTFVLSDLNDYNGKKVKQITAFTSHQGSGRPDKELTFSVQCTPNKYCLYYKNLYGGYDWLLLNPASTETYNITNYDYKRDINNTSLNHSKIQYHKTNTIKYVLKTNLLTDKQSERMRHLITSNQCWLHNLETGEIKAVNVISTSQQIKTRMSNSKKPITYQIEVESSVERIIR